MSDLNFDHYTIRVTDLDVSTNFYHGILGLPRIENRTQKDYIRWFSLGDGELHIVEGTPIETNVGIHMALKMDDLDSFISHLKSQDITLHDSKGNPDTINVRADGIRQIYFKDPDGYWIEVNESA